MVKFSVSANVSLGSDAAAGPGGEGDVLELRVHGVNNTTAPALLDVGVDEVEQVTGDKLGSFWRPTEAARTKRRPGQRGHVPEGVVREAYSWGGMVRVTPDLGATGAAATIPAAIARVLYALILPFSIANAVQWARPLDVADRWTRRTWWPRVWAMITASASRLFSLALTLMLTVTAASVALDLGSAQCAAQSERCGPIEGVMSALGSWTPGQRIAVFALAPIVAVAVLWVLSGVARLRYDVLTGIKGPDRTAALRGRRVPALARAGFWSNRVTRDLARAHMSAAILLSVLLALAQADVLWGASALGPWAGAVRDTALILLAGAVAVAALVPTGSLGAEEDAPKQIAHFFASIVLAGAILVGGAGLVLVALAPSPETPLPAVTQDIFRWLLTAAGAIALTGLLWRGLRRVGRTAWLSTGPFVLMTVSLALASAVSAIVTVGVRDLVQTAPVDGEPPVAAVVVPDVYPAVGALVLVAVVVGAIILGAAILLPRSLHRRAALWGQAIDPDGLDLPDGGVLPPSPKALFERVAAKRRFAARLHLVEPVMGVLAVLLAVALLLAVCWAGAAAAAGTPLWQAAAIFGLDVESSGRLIRTFLDIAAPVLGWLGVAIVAALVSGAATGGQRPLGIVWDIACYLPRTGHPFGPPCYAERAVPEIAGRLFEWVSQADRRRAVLSAHSMGAVLSVSALALLASQPATRGALSKISLLTFGVQLRTYFGRMLPDLLGPDALGVAPSRPPVLTARDPWGWDLRIQQDHRAEAGAADAPPPLREMSGDILMGASVPWINLWRLTDYLGFPVMSTARSTTRDGKARRANEVDRYAQELDASGYMVEVGTHGEYYRVQAYSDALADLVARGSA